MRTWLVDIAAGVAIALAVVLILMFVSFNSTFIYRGF
jgi:hypothetical protein